jgi:hypothetical protein
MKMMINSGNIRTCERDIAIDMGYGASFLYQTDKERLRTLENEKLSLEKRKNDIKLQLLSSHCPKRILEKEGIIKVENKKNKP